MRKKKNAEEAKEREYPAVSETEDETEEETETAEIENSSDSDIDDLTVDTQPFLKSKKKSTKAIPKSNTLEKAGHKTKRSNSDAGLTDPDNSAKKTKVDLLKEKDGKTHSVSSKEGEGRRKIKLFNDHNVDVNLHNEAPQNIKVKKIKMSQSLIVLCQMIEGVDMKGNFNNDFAAMTFQKKMKDGKAYEFSIPLALAPTLQNAAQIMIDANPQFFSGIKKFRE